MQKFLDLNLKEGFKNEKSLKAHDSKIIRRKLWLIEINWDLFFKILNEWLDD